MIIPNPITVPMMVAESTQQVSLGISSNLERLAIGLAVAVQTVAGARYEGAYEVTPTQETQILETAGLVMNSNVTIEPIPSNYGLITWNGSVLTVS